MKSSLLAIIFVACFASFALIKLPAPDPAFHLYLLVGQSNMAGRGVVDSVSRQTNPRILMLTKDNQWVLAHDPLHFDKPAVVGVGPGLSFAQEMLKQHPTARIGLIPCAVGGSNIGVWRPGAYYEPTKSYPYDDAIRRVKMAMQSGILKGIIWHQGEADSSPERATQYEANLKALIQAFRTEFNAPNLPFVVGELPDFQIYRTDSTGKATVRQGAIDINKTFHQLAGSETNVGVISARNTQHKGDVVHFDTPSARLLGRRYAEAMIQLQKQAK